MAPAPAPAVTHDAGAPQAPRRRRRSPAPPPKDFKDRSSYEKIVGACMLPAELILTHLEETEPCYRSFTEENLRGGLLQLALVEMAVGLCVGSVVWCVLKGVALALRRVQRPKYYPQERMRRQALARERRRIRRRTTINAAPTADELLAQWAKVKRNPEEMIRFGSMLCDLEAYVDNSLLRNENGEIVGRNPGIRGWLNANCQPLAAHYKTVMGYKAMAEKFRQAVGLADPYPAALALDGIQNTVRKSGDDAAVAEEDGEGSRQNTVRKDDERRGRMEGAEANGEPGTTNRRAQGRTAERRAHGTVCRMAQGRTAERRAHGSVCRMAQRRAEERRAHGSVCRMAQRRAEEMLAACGRSQRGVRLALAARLSPDQVPPEVEREERRRQGLPPRDGLARRFVQMMA